MSESESMSIFMYKDLLLSISIKKNGWRMTSVIVYITK